MTTPAIHRIHAASPRRRSPARAGTRSQTFVFRFDQLPEVKRTAKTWDEVKALLGGKGANLAEMTRLGLPVPPGFIVTTAACNAFLAAGGSLPPGTLGARCARRCASSSARPASASATRRIRCSSPAAPARSSRCRG